MLEMFETTIRLSQTQPLNDTLPSLFSPCWLLMLALAAALMQLDETQGWKVEHDHSLAPHEVQESEETRKKSERAAKIDSILRHHMFQNVRNDIMHNLNLHLL